MPARNRPNTRSRRTTRTPVARRLPNTPAVAEALESRLLKSAGDPTSLADGVLSVHGTDEGDTILVYVVPSADKAEVTLNGEKKSFFGAVEQVRVYGYEGEDTIDMLGQVPLRAWGHGGKDVIHAGGADDVLRGGPGDDELYGGNGEDIIYGNSGADKIVGGRDKDTLYGDSNPKRVVWAFGPAGWQKVADDLDEVTTGDQRQVIGGQDRLTTGLEREATAPREDYQFVVTSVYDRVVAQTKLGAGQVVTDVVDQLRVQSEKVVPVKNDGAVFGPGLDTGPDVALDGGTSPGTIPSWVFGPNDEIWGDGGVDTIYGGPGNDVLHGGEDEDTIYGEDGDDTIYGDGGRDVLWGGIGGDTIHGGGSIDEIHGEQGQDTLHGDGGNDYLYGDENDDWLYGGAGADELHGGDGRDKLQGGPYYYGDTLYGDCGEDWLWGEKGNDYLYGGADADVIYGGDGQDQIHGGFGEDRIYGNDGEDTIEGGADNDEIHGDQVGGPGAADTIDGGPGNDTIYGEVGDDTIHGGWGVDTINGGIGNDTIYGGWELDIIHGGEDDDTIFGEYGDDILCGNDGDDTIHGGPGTDRMWGMAGEDVMYGDSGEDTLRGGDDRDVLYGGTGEDWLYGGEGHDCLNGEEGDDHLYGEAGMDGLFAYQDNDTVDGGAGSDRYYFASAYLASHYAAGEDAGFSVLDSAGGDNDDGSWTAGHWSQEELTDLDDVLLMMQEHKGSDMSIQKAGGGAVTWVRAGAYTSKGSGNPWGWNGAGIITLNDNAFTSARRFGISVVHELGHNWDDEGPAWEAFLSLSSWVEVQSVPDKAVVLEDGPPDGYAMTERYGEMWLYDPSADFVRDYGFSHPKEDWATCWEAYFYGDPDGTSAVPDPDNVWMQTNLFLKCALVHQILG